jgi:hypothetical protein
MFPVSGFADLALKVPLLLRHHPPFFNLVGNGVPSSLVVDLEVSNQPFAGPKVHVMAIDKALSLLDCLYRPRS